MSDIDCSLLLEAMQYYKKLGYTPLSCPMLVDRDIIDITLPEGKVARECNGKYYVGSAEQSFYQMIKDGFRPEGKYMLITPCERDEVEDEYHFGIFLKVELVSNKVSYQSILEDALSFYRHKRFDVKVVREGLGKDILIGGIEVGSFGSRCYLGESISFGTGLALPRISQTIEKEI